MALWEEASLLSGMDLIIQQCAQCEGIYGDKWGVAEVYCPQIEQD